MQYMYFSKKVYAVYSLIRSGNFREFCVKSNLTVCKVTFNCKLQKQESLAIAKTTARCAQYMGALKSFESPRKRPRLLFQKFVKGFCSDRH